ncbi:MAG: 30S ribosomal protein S20 [Candidatus Absconditabacteria bacterium]|nr:30S ribosomal protein S20 [Candidatus Absconditabacteria bacterium]
MPVTKSAKKAHARSLKLQKRNYDFKLRMKMAIKKFMKNITKGVDVAETEVQALYKYIDKACKVGVLRKQTAARRKSRVAKLFNTAKKNK